MGNIRSRNDRTVYAENRIGGTRCGNTGILPAAARDGGVPRRDTVTPDAMRVPKAWR
jgi:hypothetical protein